MSHTLPDPISTHPYSMRGAVVEVSCLCVEVDMPVDVLVKLTVVLLAGVEGVLEEGTSSASVSNLYDVDPIWNVIRSHVVLYRLHWPIWKYVIALHVAFCAHSLWHACRSATLLGDVNNNTSPAAVSQIEKMPVTNHDPTNASTAVVDVLPEVVVGPVVVVPFVVVTFVEVLVAAVVLFIAVVVVAFVEAIVVDTVVAVLVVFGIDAIGTNRIAIIPPLCDHTLVHSVLNRLHHLLSKNVML